MNFAGLVKFLYWLNQLKFLNTAFRA
jgi:hypothetical protein